MQKSGLIAPYKSPMSAAYPEGFKDPNGYWTDLYDNLLVPAYNTNKVRREELPKRYEDMFRPRWKGRIALDQNEDRWFANMLHLMGEKKGVRIHGSVGQATNQLSPRALADHAMTSRRRV